MKEKTAFILSHWKLGVHLIFKTKRFGVDNRWWSPFPSLWGIPWYRIFINCFLVYPLIRHYQAMKVRLGPSVALVPKKEYQLMYGKKNSR